MAISDTCVVLEKCGGNTNAMEHGLLLLGKSDVDWDAQPGVVETQDLKGLEISTVTGEMCCGSGEAVMRGSRTSALLWACPRPAATTVCLLLSIPSCSSLLALGHPPHPAVPWAAISTGLCPPGGRVLSVLEHPIRLVGFSTGKQLM